MKTISLLTILALALIGKASHAQCRSCLPATLFSWTGDRSPLGELDSITTDRPDFTEASSAVGLGVTQIESGYTFTKSGGSESHSWGEPLLRQGLFANWFEMRLALAPVSQADVFSKSGIEDLYLGSKIGLTQQDGFLPEMAIVPQMTVPTGSSSFSANRVLPGVNLLYGWDISERFTFAGSTQYNRAVDDTLSPYDEWAQSLTTGTSITKNVGAYLEWYALFPDNSFGANTQHYINGGFTYTLTDDMQWDVRVGKGLSDESDDYFVGAGVSLRFR